MYVSTYSMHSCVWNRDKYILLESFKKSVYFSVICILLNVSQQTLGNKIKFILNYFPL